MGPESSLKEGTPISKYQTPNGEMDLTENSANSESKPTNFSSQNQLGQAPAPQALNEQSWTGAEADGRTILNTFEYIKNSQREVNFQTVPNSDMEPTGLTNPDAKAQSAQEDTYETGSNMDAQQLSNQLPVYKDGLIMQHI